MNFEIYRTVVQILYISTLNGILLVLLSEDSNTGVYFFLTKQKYLELL